MKKTIVLFVLIILGLSNNIGAQTKFTTGDVELDKAMTSITKYSRSNMEAFQDAVVGKYSITKEQTQAYTAKLSAGDLLLVFEIAIELKKTTNEVSDFYIANRIKKNWAEIIKELGVSTKSFEIVKNKVVNNGII